MSEPGKRPEASTTALLKRVWNKVSGRLQRPKSLASILGVSLDPGDVVGSFRVEGEIGRGASGAVYRTVDERDGSVRALKVLSGKGTGDLARRRFEREIAAVRSLDHPNLIRILESGEHEGHPWFAMEYVEGRSFEPVLRERGARPGRVGIRDLRPLLEALRGALEGMAAAHAANVVHRDLKPANLLVDRTGNVRVTDFGLAKRTDSGSLLTGEGEVLGTPNYMAPEQTSGKLGTVGPWTDVFALGVVLYRILTGRLPFRAGRPVELFHLIAHREPAPPRRENPDVPPDLERICLKALEKEPRHRYADAREFAADLRRFLEGVSVAPQRTTVAYRALRAAGRPRPWAWTIAGLAVALLIALAIAWLRTS